MHIVIGEENGMIRIAGQGFVVYVKDTYNFYRFIQHIHIVHVSFDKSINPELKEKIKVFFN